MIYYIPSGMQTLYSLFLGRLGTAAQSYNSQETRVLYLFINIIAEKKEYYNIIPSWLIFLFLLCAPIL